MLLLRSLLRFLLLLLLLLLLFGLLLLLLLSLCRISFWRLSVLSPRRRLAALQTHSAQPFFRGLQLSIRNAGRPLPAALSLTAAAAAATTAPSASPAAAAAPAAPL